MRLGLVVMVLVIGASPRACLAQSRPRMESFSALASDRTANAVGDLLTIVVYESTTASNTASSSSSKNSKLRGNVAAGTNFNETAGLGLSGSSDNSGSISRSGKMVTELSVTVVSILPNGDLNVAGEQDLIIAGEHSHIRLSGRVRAPDISSGNTVMSYRLADARIEYNGKGYASRGAKPGIVTRIFSALGLM